MKLFLFLLMIIIILDLLLLHYSIIYRIESHNINNIENDLCRFFIKFYKYYFTILNIKLDPIIN
jgi:hypothetical protein